MKKILSVSLILLFTLPFCSRAQKSDSPRSSEIEDKIRQVETHLCSWAKLSENDAWTLEERMKYWRVKGLSIAVVHNFRVEWARGYGWADEAEQRPVTTNTLFQAGSISKSLNGVGVMLLVQQHRLNLNDDINKHLRSWKFPYDSVSEGKVITIGNLLSHTGGLSIHGFPGYQRQDSLPTLEEVLDGKKPANTGAVRSIQEPGKSWIYSGGGITISQVIVQDVTGMPYDQFMWRSVLQPMEMTNSSYTQPPPDSKDRATGYLWAAKEVPGKYHIYPEQAAAGLWTTPTDLGKYIVETQLSLEGKSAKVLNQTTTKLRIKPYIDSIYDHGNQFGEGVFLLKKGADKYFSHQGSDVGFLSIYYGSLQHGEGVVVMINNDINMDLIREVVNSVARVYRWEGFYQPEERKIISIAKDSLDQYTGVYAANGDTVSISRDGNALFYRSNFMGSDHFEPLLFLTPESFFILEEGRQVFYFARDARGVLDRISVKNRRNNDKILVRQAKDVQFAKNF